MVAGRVLSARQVRKVHPYRVDAFDGSGTGPQGWVEEGRVRWATGGLPRAAAAGLPAIALPPAGQWPQVELLHSHAGCNSAVALAVMQAWHAAGVRAVVVVGTGNGTVHQELGAALDWAQVQGMVLCITTRCEEGPVVQAQGTQDDHVSSLPAAKARISLMLELMGWPRALG